ncbi:DUF5305 family protein [Halapricum hydrolyticum]|uniref:DUF5305 domain-containing protein n=1 Tax=Halapricum hydrolyticum TaxID=2979991 RepID=A0AAE3IG15_9EURY|nr:DUF5305 family protein [Halapricum hydrolyticum]MCU4719010.1 DUF5305 domain-containing protein [Halapricum hydrolyticum]MCU4727939.1 DUF5305 domain-containing protein [Halapricum hydrolyticum]
MGPRGLRVRAVIERYFGVVALVLALLVVVGGGVAYGAHAGPDERAETTTERVTTWNSTGQFSHEATVVEDTRVFDAGETLANRTQYFQRIAPTLEGAFVYDYAASNGSITANASMTLVMRSVTEDGTEQWRVSETLDRTNRTLAPGDPLRLSFEQNVTAVETELQEIRSELGTTAGTAETVFEARLRLDGTRNGEPVETTRSYRLPFTIEDGLYRVNDTGPVVNEGERTIREERTVPITVGPVRSYGGPLVAVLGLGGLVGLAVGRRQDWFDVGEREREYLAYRSDRREFDEWITEVKRPADRLADADARIETASLAGLVDLAIDTDRRVLETPDERYLVFENDVVYRYEPPQLPRDGGDPLEETDGPIGDGHVDQSGLLGRLGDSADDEHDSSDVGPGASETNGQGMESDADDGTQETDDDGTQDTKK